MSSKDERDVEDVLRRVQKLLAIASDERANPNEAAAAAQMAEKVMRRYQLDHADVLAAQLKAEAGAVTYASVFGHMFRDDANVPPRQRNPLWAQHLAVAIARLNDCEVQQSSALNQRGRRNCTERCLTFYGFALDVQLCAWMFDYIVSQLILSTRRFAKEEGERWRYGSIGDGKGETNSFRLGFTTIVTGRIYRQLTEKSNELLEHATGTALVVAKKAAIEKQFGEFKYTETNEQSARDDDALASGMAAGRKVDLNIRGVGGPSDTKQLALR